MLYLWTNHTTKYIQLTAVSRIRRTLPMHVLSIIIFIDAQLTTNMNLEIFAVKFDHTVGLRNADERFKRNFFFLTIYHKIR